MILDTGTSAWHQLGTAISPAKVERLYDYRRAGTACYDFNDSQLEKKLYCSSHLCAMRSGHNNIGRRNLGRHGACCHKEMMMIHPITFTLSRVQPCPRNLLDSVAPNCTAATRLPRSSFAHRTIKSSPLIFPLSSTSYLQIYCSHEQTRTPERTATRPFAVHDSREKALVLRGCPASLSALPY